MYIYVAAHTTHTTLFLQRGHADGNAFGCAFGPPRRRRLRHRDAFSQLLPQYKMRLVFYVYSAAMLTAMRLAARLGLPVGAAYAIAMPLVGYFALRPAAAAAEVWAGWWEPDMLAYQAIYAPLSWPITIQLVCLSNPRVDPNPHF